MSYSVRIAAFSLLLALLTALVIGVEAGDTARAYPFGAVKREGVINDRVGGRPVVVTVADDTLVAYDRRIGGRVRSVTPAGPDHLRAAGSRWASCVARRGRRGVRGAGLDLELDERLNFLCHRLRGGANAGHSLPWLPRVGLGGESGNCGDDAGGACVFRGA